VGRVSGAMTCGSRNAACCYECSHVHATPDMGFASPRLMPDQRTIPNQKSHGETTMATSKKPPTDKSQPSGVAPPAAADTAFGATDSGPARPPAVAGGKPAV